jgi:hypothetical protein
MLKDSCHPGIFFWQFFSRAKKHPDGFQVYTVDNAIPGDCFRIETEFLLGSRTGLLERKTHRNAVQNIGRAG